MQNFLVPIVVEQTGRGERTWDIYSRLLVDRIIFLGTPVDDIVSNIIIAQLLFLQMSDAEKGHPSLHQFARRQRHGRAGDLRHHAISDLRREHLLRRAGGEHGRGAAGGGHQGQALRAAERAHHDPPAVGRRAGPGHRHQHPGQGNPAAQGPPERNPGQAHAASTVEEVAKDTDRDNFMSAEEAKTYGLVDQVVQSRKEIPSSTEKNSVSV